MSCGHIFSVVELSWLSVSCMYVDFFKKEKNLEARSPTESLLRKEFNFYLG